jgi:hypothetical protein
MHNCRQCEDQSDDDCRTHPSSVYYANGSDLTYHRGEKLSGSGGVMNSFCRATGIRRRSLAYLPMACFGLARNVFAAEKKPISSALPYVLPTLKWQPSNLYSFISSLPNEVRLELKKSAGLLPPAASVASLKSNDQDASDIQKRVLWLSSNVLAYPFRKATKLDYHSLITWVSESAGVSKPIVQSSSTFVLERELFKCCLCSYGTR